MIYLIDDDDSVRRGFELFLKSEGLDFKSLDGAEEFLTRFKPGTADLLILDLNLPGINGCDLLQKLSTLGINIPVIVVTAFDDACSREFCRLHGVKAYLRKPVDGDALLDTIKYILLPDSNTKTPKVT